MKKNYKWITALSCFTIAGLLVTACGSSPSNSSTNTSQPASASASTATNAKDKFKGQTLNLLTWEGYGDPKIVKKFEDDYGVKVNPTYFRSSDELIAKLKSGGGSSYDIISPSGDVAGLLVQSDMVEPIDTSKLTHYKELEKKLQLPDVEKGGKNYGIPYVWVRS